MKSEDRDTILEAVDILRALGGNNGFSNLQPKTKKTLLQCAGKLKGIVEQDISRQHRVRAEAFDGDIIYGNPEEE